MAFVDYISSELGQEPKWNSSDTEASYDCPFCVDRGETEDTKQRFRFNEEKMVGVCYNCGWGGSAITFVKDLQGVNWSDAYDIVNYYSKFRPLPQDIFDEVFEKLYLEGNELEVSRKVIPLPRDFRLLSETAALTSEPYRKYALSRGLTEDQIALHGCGYCMEGEIKLENQNSVYLKNRLVIQVRDDEQKMLYWMGRAVSPKLKPKTFNPVGQKNTLNKSDVIFNLNNAKKTGAAVITEGVFDATTVGNSGVALFGKTLSAKQLLLLIKAELDAVYVMLDNDATRNAIQIAEVLSKHIDNTYLCYIKESGADPNSLGRSGCLEVLRGAEKFDRLTALKYKLYEK